MKILHLEASTGWGGQEIRILNECVEMQKRGHFVVLGVERKALLVQRAKEQNIKVYQLNFRRPFWLITLFRLIWILLRHKIDLINTHSSLDAWIGGIAGRLLRKKVVRTRHLSTLVKGGLNSNILYGYLADHVVTTCKSVISHLVKQSNRTHCHFTSIPTGVDPSKIIASQSEALNFRRLLGICPSSFLVGTACFMRSWKGLDDFLAAANLLKNDTSIQWVIIGGGHEATYRKKAKELKLDGVVHFSGHLESPYSAILSLDVFALLSTANEGVSQAILQAAYLERPLVATPTGGLQEVCIQDKTGISVPIRSPEKIVEAVLYLKNNPQVCREFGLQGKKLVLEQFTFDRTLDNMERLYERIGHERGMDQG